MPRVRGSGDENSGPEVAPDVNQLPDRAEGMKYLKYNRYDTAQLEEASSNHGRPLVPASSSGYQLPAVIPWAGVAQSPEEVGKTLKPTPRQLEISRDGGGYSGTLSASFADPQTWLAGGLSGLLGRAFIFPIVERDYTKWMASEWTTNTGQTRLRQAQTSYATRPRPNILMHRFWYSAIFFGIYVPCLRHVQHYSSDQLGSGVGLCEDTPQARALRIFGVGFSAAFLARLITGPIRQVSDASATVGMKKRHVLGAMLQSQQGLVSIFIGQHPMITSGIYMGTTMFLFEGLRRLMARRVLKLESPDDFAEFKTKQDAIDEPRWKGLTKHAFLNGACGAVATLFGSTLTYVCVSRKRYRQLTAHTNTIERGLVPLLRKEVPMAAAAFYAFTLINGMLSPHHVHGGFGY